MINQYGKRVVIESPYGGDIEANTQYARRCVRDSVLRGEAPIASHILFTQEGVLRDEISEERKLGIAAGHAWICVCNLVAVYTDLGISKGMQQGIDLAGELRVPVEERRLGRRRPIGSSCRE